MSDFEQWAENDDYAMNFSLERDEDGRYCDIHVANMLIGWQAAIASMQGEAVAKVSQVTVGMSLNGPIKSGQTYQAIEVESAFPVGTKLFTYPPSAAAKIAEQDAEIASLTKELEEVRKVPDGYALVPIEPTSFMKKSYTDKYGFPSYGAGHEYKFMVSAALTQSKGGAA